VSFYDVGAVWDLAIGLMPASESITVAHDTGFASNALDDWVSGHQELRDVTQSDEPVDNAHIEPGTTKLERAPTARRAPRRPGGVRACASLAMRSEAALPKCLAEVRIVAGIPIWAERSANTSVSHTGSARRLEAIGLLWIT